MSTKNKILSKQQQQALSPEDALNELKVGNDRYVNALFNNIDIKSLRYDSESGQNPHAIILSCIDSRVVVEQVFDQALGDVFVARVAGNFANTDIVASMEYACKVAGSKVIVVLGHEGCGAVINVCCEESHRIERVMLRDNCSKQHVIERINKQLNEHLRIEKSDYVIYNNPNDQILSQVHTIHTELLKLSQ